MSETWVMVAFQGQGDEKKPEKETKRQPVNQEKKKENVGAWNPMEKAYQEERNVVHAANR